MLCKRMFAAIGLLFCVLVGSAGAQDLLEPEVAFRASARLVKTGMIEVKYDTAPGYYLYRDRLQFAVEPATVTLGKAQLPPGKVKQDEFFGKSVIYRKRTIVRLPLSASPGETFTLTADLQGCADIGVCYPPVRRQFVISGNPASRK